MEQTRNLIILKHMMKQFSCFSFSNLSTLSSFSQHKKIKTSDQLGDKIILPHELVHHFSNLSDHVFVLKLTVPKKKTEIYVGILDFATDPHMVFVPNWIYNDLGISDDKNRIHCDLIQPPKATKIIVKNINSIDDLNAHKILEYILTKHTVVYINKKISVDFLDANYTFIIDQVFPESPALIVDCDIELDFI